MKASPQFIPLSPTRKRPMKNKELPSAAAGSWLRKFWGRRRFKQQKKKSSDNMSSLTTTSWSRSQPLLATYPDMTPLSDGTTSLSISSDDITSDTRVSARVTGNIYAGLPVNIVTAPNCDEKKSSIAEALTEDGAVEQVAHDWVDFPHLIFRSTPRKQTMSYSSDSIIETMMPWDDADDEVNNDDGARKRLFGEDYENLDWNGFLAGSVDEETTRLRQENKLLRKKLEEMSTAAIERQDSQNDTKSLQNKVDELEAELLRSKKRLEVAAETNVAINDAHDRKAEECQELKRDMETFANSYAAQHEKLEQLEGRLRKLMTENEQLRASNKDFAVLLNSNSTKTLRKGQHIYKGVNDVK